MNEGLVFGSCELCYWVLPSPCWFAVDPSRVRLVEIRITRSDSGQILADFSVFVVLPLSNCKCAELVGGFLAASTPVASKVNADGGAAVVCAQFGKG